MSVTIRQKGKRRKDLLTASIACLLLSACTSFPAWRDQTLREVAEGTTLTSKTGNDSICILLQRADHGPRIAVQCLSNEGVA